MSTKKISVIIPAYNVEKYILSGLQALEKQTHKNLEIILINDGSKDSTDAIIREYLKSTALDIHYISQENHGQAYARNRGLEVATGEYIAFIDSDDRIEVDYLEKLYEAAETYQADVVNSGYRTVKEDGTILTEVSVSPFAHVCDYGRAGIFVVWSRLYRRAFLSEYNITFPENKLYEDVPFSLAAKFYAKCVKSIDYIGYSYVQNSTSTMSSQRIQNQKFPFTELKELLSNMRNLSASAYEALEFEVLHFFTGFLFLYCRKLAAKDLFAFCSYALDILKTNFTKYYKNSYLGLSRSKELPLYYRAAILVFVTTARLHLLKPFAWLITRIIKT